MTGLTVIDKIWDAHVIKALAGGEDLLFIDRNILHDLTVRIVLPDLQKRGYTARSPEMTFAVPDHAISTAPGRNRATDDRAKEFGQRTRQLAQAGGITFFEMDGPDQGIVHVIGPELGLTQPGITIVGTDSHTCTHGALGSLAWGVGTSEAAHVLATQTAVLRRPKRMRMTIEGSLGPGVSAKDVILAIIAEYGAASGSGHAIEFAGGYIRAASVEERMTICNMSVEFGSRTGVVAADDTTINYLEGRDFTPRGRDWDRAVKLWRSFATDDEAIFDAELSLDATLLEPRVTFGTAVDRSIPIGGRIPEPETLAGSAREDMIAALNYIGLVPGSLIEGTPVEWAFIGSCANGRLSDLREAAAVMKGRKVPEGVKAWIVPGSTEVKRAAEAEGLDQIFLKAGAEWRESGCSLCCAVNGEVVGPGERCISTSNRNFVGRQGAQARTHLASPAMVAAAAVTGKITDVRKLLS